MKKVGWTSIAPIFADVVMSPWNLLVGGLLIKYLSTPIAVLSIIIGYLFLSILFIYYGGIGYKKKQQSSEIISGVLNSKITKYLIPSILAIGQIGWASINIELGGKSLAYILSSPIIIGMILYALFLIMMAALNLYKMGIVKLFITLSSIGLLIYVFISKLATVSLSNFIIYVPKIEHSLLWGISIVVASLISFTTVTPDFFQSIRSKKDIILSSIFGLFLPGIITALLGCFLFFDKNNFDLIILISALTFPIFPHILNALTNTDGSIAIYTPALKLKSMFKIDKELGIIIAAVISLSLALIRVSTYLEIWLNILSLLFPSFIGIVLVTYLIKDQKEKQSFAKYSFVIYILSIIISIGLTKYFPSVLFSLISPIILFKLYYYLKNKF
ncbi:MAG: hypothetical protein Q7R95_06700 [bacterium]|nr:hypothetical protein [bacterium]